MGLVTAIPWMARTVMISGWLIYPFTALDLFDVDWKMDAFYIDIDAMQIKVWGRALYDISLVDVPISGWFPNWFSTTLSGMEKIMILGAFASTLVTVLATIIVLLRKIFKHLDMLLVMVTMFACYLFWQISAPLMRYGYAYVLLFIFIVFGWCLQTLLPWKSSAAANWKKICHISVYFVILFYGIYKVYVMADYIYSSRLANHYIWQQDYGVYEVENYEIEGEIFYYPVNGDRTGYDAFPSAPTKAELEFRGTSIKDGFRKNSD